MLAGEEIDGDFIDLDPGIVHEEQHAAAGRR
jgi:hypothetical protein